MFLIFLLKGKILVLIQVNDKIWIIGGAVFPANHSNETKSAADRCVGKNTLCTLISWKTIHSTLLKYLVCLKSKVFYFHLFFFAFSWTTKTPWLLGPQILLSQGQKWRVHGLPAPQRARLPGTSGVLWHGNGSGRLDCK